MQLSQINTCESEAAKVRVDSSDNGTIVSTSFKALHIQYYLIFLTF